MADRLDHRAVCPVQELVDDIGHSVLDDMPPGWAFTLIVYPNNHHQEVEPHVHYVFSHPHDDADAEEKEIAKADALAAIAVMQRRLQT